MSTAMFQPATGWLKARSGAELLSLAGIVWVLSCLGAVGLLTLSYRRSLTELCPAGSDYEIFCRAHQADQLLASLIRVGLVFALGATLIGLVSLLLGSAFGRSSNLE